MQIPVAGSGKHTRTSVLVVDDHPSVCEMLRVLLAGEPALCIVGEARDAKHAIDFNEQAHPDLVIMDLGLPDIGGIEATRTIKTHTPQCTIVILTVHEELYYVVESLKAGAAGYVLKRTMSSDLLTAIEATTSGGQFVSPMANSAY
ncbi:MAG TPA: response regulator transcription factor [Chloroflexota bacterium]